MLSNKDDAIGDIADLNPYISVFGTVMNPRIVLQWPKEKGVKKREYHKWHREMQEKILCLITMRIVSFLSVVKSVN